MRIVKENVDCSDRRHISSEFFKFYKIIDLVLYGIYNNYNFVYEEIDISDGSKLRNIRFELSGNSTYYINIDFYEKTNFFDIEFSYKFCEIDYLRNSLKTHSLEVVLGCINEISKLVNRSLND